QRPGAVVNDASRLVLVHAEEDEMAGEIAGLRRAADDFLVDPAGERLEAPGRVSHRIAEVVCAGVPEERAHVAERGGAGAQDVGILHLVRQLIKQGRIEPVPQAYVDGQAAWQMGRIQICGNARERTVIDGFWWRTFQLNAAFAEGPVT